MLTNADLKALQECVEAALSDAAISQTEADYLTGKLTAMLTPEPQTPTTHCMKCGRAFGDPANADCDMQPCFFQ